jgi:hypothetical protein
MRALAKTMFVLLILTAGSLDMLGQNTLFVNDIPPLLAFSSDTQSEIELSAVLTASTYQFYMEERIQIEDWMIVQKEWKHESETELASILKVEPESEMLFEGWMIQPYSTVSRDWDFLAEVVEEPLVVHQWMICCTDWNLNAK